MLATLLRQQIGVKPKLIWQATASANKLNCGIYANAYEKKHAFFNYF